MSCIGVHHWWVNTLKNQLQVQFGWTWGFLYQLQKYILDWSSIAQLQSDWMKMWIYFDLRHFIAALAGCLGWLSSWKMNPNPSLEVFYVASSRFFSKFDLCFIFVFFHKALLAWPVSLGEHTVHLSVDLQSNHKLFIFKYWVEQSSMRHSKIFQLFHTSFLPFFLQNKLVKSSNFHAKQTQTLQFSWCDDKPLLRSALLTHHFRRWQISSECHKSSALLISLKQMCILCFSPH